MFFGSLTCFAANPNFIIHEHAFEGQPWGKAAAAAQGQELFVFKGLKTPALILPIFEGWRCRNAGDGARSHNVHYDQGYRLNTMSSSKH